MFWIEDFGERPDLMSLQKIAVAEAGKVKPSSIAFRVSWGKPGAAKRSLRAADSTLVDAKAHIRCAACPMMIIKSKGLVISLG